MSAPLLQRLGGLSRQAIGRTRALLGHADSPPNADTGNRSDRTAMPRNARSGPATSHPVILPAEQHGVGRSDMSRSALKVLDKLCEAGYSACLVGGGVRDALVGLKPKDFDIATDATPEQVKSLFRNSRIIGRRFRLVHVVFGREIIEVATFRAGHDSGEGGEIAASGRIVRDNVFGSIEEDAWRRDFSVNALYWNVADGSVIDYTGGLADIEARVFRLIGDPLTRCEEDPVRVLRAVRLASKLDFSIEADTLRAMQRTSDELGNTPPARLFEEVLKLFQGGYAEQCFDAVREHDLLKHLFPQLDRRLSTLDAPARGNLQSLLRAALANTDRRVAQGKPITPAYLLAFMLWPDVEEAALARLGDGMPVQDALHEASEAALHAQLPATSIPRRFSGPMKEIWHMQPRLEQYRGERALTLMEDRRFRAAYDFLCLRAGVDEALQPVADWWTDVQELPIEARPDAATEKPVSEHVWGSAGARSGGKKRPARRRRKPRRAGGDKGAARQDG